MSERDIATLYRTLADADRRGAPSFSSVRARRVPPRRAPVLPAAAAVAAGLLLAVAVVGRKAPDDSLRTAIARARALSSWSEPTAALLDPLDPTMTRSVPTLTLLDEE